MSVGFRRQEGLNLTTRQRRGLLAFDRLADEARDTGRVADAVPRLVVHLATDQQVAREDLLQDGLLLAVLELVDFFHRNDDLVDLVFHVHRLNASVEVRRDLLLVARLRVHDVPLARAQQRIVVRLLFDGGNLVRCCLRITGRSIGVTSGIV